MLLSGVNEDQADKVHSIDSNIMLFRYIQYNFYIQRNAKKCKHITTWGFLSVCSKMVKPFTFSFCSPVLLQNDLRNVNNGPLICDLHACIPGTHRIWALQLSQFFLPYLCHHLLNVKKPGAGEHWWKDAGTKGQDSLCTSAQTLSHWPS